ncbi:MAG: hypothetical protein RUDDFDWM_000470 [Candidatus Fervidibacterota bacterium]
MTLLRRLKRNEKVEPSDWIVVVARGLTLLLLISLIAKGWIGEVTALNALALLFALLFDAIAIMAHWRGIPLRAYSLIADMFWMGLWMIAEAEHAVNFYPLLLLIIISSGMWYRLLGAFITATVCAVFYLLISLNTNIAGQPWATASALSFLFITALLIGYMAEAKLTAEQVAMRYRYEMFISADLHRRMTPKSLPNIECWQIARECIPARGEKTGGGDFHDFITCNDGSIVIAVGDVSGKGVDAQLKVPLVKSAIRATMNLCHELRDAVRHANSILASEFSDEDFAGAVFVRLKEGNSFVEAVNAGHLPILILRSDGTIEHIHASGPPLGVFNDSDYAQTQMHIQAGDLIVMLTDGLTEARNANGETYGVERIKNLLSRIRHLMPHEIASCVVEDVRRFQGYILNDDLTIIVAKYMPNRSFTGDDVDKPQHSDR